MSDDKHLTPWFPATVKPTRIGVYIRQYPSGDTYYARFDGVKWRSFYNTVKLAARKTNCVSGFQDLPWRGLAKDPS